jgi:hypothetical protein
LPAYNHLSLWLKLYSTVSSSKAANPIYIDIRYAYYVYVIMIYIVCLIFGFSMVNI